MGACTVSIEQGNRYVATERERLVTISPSATYATGGDSIAAADCQLTAIDNVELENVESTGTRIGVYVKTGNLLKVFTALGAEAGAGTDQHTFSFRARVVGY